MGAYVREEGDAYPYGEKVVLVPLGALASAANEFSLLIDPHLPQLIVFVSNTSC